MDDSSVSGTGNPIEDIDGFIIAQLSVGFDDSLISCRIVRIADRSEYLLWVQSVISIAALATDSVLAKRGSYNKENFKLNHYPPVYLFANI
jgi:hypothetical protein